MVMMMVMMNRARISRSGAILGCSWFLPRQGFVAEHSQGQVHCILDQRLYSTVPGKTGQL